MTSALDQDFERDYQRMMLGFLRQPSLRAILTPNV